MFTIILFSFGQSLILVTSIKTVSLAFFADALTVKSSGNLTMRLLSTLAGLMTFIIKQTKNRRKPPCGAPLVMSTCSISTPSTSYDSLPSSNQKVAYGLRFVAFSFSQTMSCGTETNASLRSKDIIQTKSMSSRLHRAVLADDVDM